jgi:3-hydroxybutyryl-CoA dehydrogenase
MTKVSIIGPGTMGRGIAQVCLQAGYDVTLISYGEESAKRGLERLKQNLNKAVEKGKLTEEEKSKFLDKAKISWKIEDIKDSDIFIEAVNEDLKLKEEVFKY